jgi:hypothetical protein
MLRRHAVLSVVVAETQDAALAFFALVLASAVPQGWRLFAAVNKNQPAGRLAVRRQLMERDIENLVRTALLTLSIPGVCEFPRVMRAERRLVAESPS